MKFYCRIFILLIFTAAPTFAQGKKTPPPPPDKEFLKTEAQAKAYFEAEKYRLARPLYQYLDSIKPNTPSYLFPLGVCLVQLGDNENALSKFELCIKKSSAYPASLSYFTARAYHLSLRFDEAIRYYEKYKAFLKKSDSKKKDALISNVDRQIKMCKNGKELIADPLPIQVYNLGPIVNSPFPEYGPVITVDEKQLIFTSNRPNTTGGQKTEDGIYYEDVYISYRSDTGWSHPVKMNEGINTIGHDASKCISPNGEKMIIYRYGKDKMLSQASGDLYMSEFKNNTWSKAERLPDKINSPGWEPSASIGDDEKIIYFVSSRSGGQGGTDIYSIKKLPTGEWAEPMNLGPTINTPDDEDSPFISPDGKTLYFSSNGHKTMGGYDIFKSEYNEEKKQWSIPLNVGYPISTAHDDLYFQWSADGQRVYFSSVRPEGYGDKDIYYAVINKKATEMVIFKGEVLNAVNKKPVEATIKVTEKNTNQVIGIFKADGNDGSYMFVLNGGKEYLVNVEADNFASVSESYNLKELREFREEEKNILLQPK